MKSSFNTALSHILLSEGGYVNHPRDPGGCTNKGITLATYRRIKPKATCESLKRISDELVANIYQEYYWDEVSGDDLPPGIDLVVFDMAVNAGPQRAAKLLQRIVGVDEDGFIGPITLKAVSARMRAEPINLLWDYSEAREVYYKSLRHFDTFGRGWLNRVVASTRAAQAIIDNSDPLTPTERQATLAELENLVRQAVVLIAQLRAEDL